MDALSLFISSMPINKDELIIFSYVSFMFLFIVFHQIFSFKRQKLQQITFNLKNSSSLTALILLTISPLVTYVLGFQYGYDSKVLIVWLVFFSLLVLFFDFLYWKRTRQAFSVFFSLAKKPLKFYKLHEFEGHDTKLLPKGPSDEEKYSYLKRNNYIMLFFSIISFGAIQVSMYNFLTTNELMWPLYFYFGLTVIYFLVSFVINISSKDFNSTEHKRIVKKWKSHLTESVDIFLPTAGESIDVLKNTWDGIRELRRNYRGKITVYCLDDAAKPEVAYLAKMYEFKYEVRPNRGWFKKAGNLRHGYNISNSTFVAIFDADFRPRDDMLQEMLPYFYEYKNIGLVQSPQYFDVKSSQNWLQRGAGAVQELFYRVSQVSRQNHSASICVGSNAVYRRAALADTGGTALIEHSEDVHTGFNMRMHGWTIQYIPIILAKGLCPGDMKAFFKQQYRWCLGSMTLLSSSKFWKMKISLKGRLSYFSGFLYYIHTAVSSLFVPIIPIAILVLYPEQVTLQNYLLILPSIIFVQIIYPLWHKATYGIEAWSTRTVYGWAHLFAIFDAITRNKMQWQATGTKIGRDMRYISFRVLQVSFNFIPAVLWIYLSAEKVIVQMDIIFIPILLSGIYYYFMCAKVTFYMPFKVNNKNRFKTLLQSRSVPVEAFAYASAIILITLSIYSYASINSNSYLSPVPKTFALNTNSSGSYASIANKENKLLEVKLIKSDSLSDTFQKMLSSYASESGEILTTNETNVVTSRLSERFAGRAYKSGDSIVVSTQELAIYIAESRKNN